MDNGNARFSCCCRSRFRFLCAEGERRSWRRWQNTCTRELSTIQVPLVARQPRDVPPSLLLLNSCLIYHHLRCCQSHVLASINNCSVELFLLCINNMHPDVPCPIAHVYTVGRKNVPLIFDCISHVSWSIFITFAVSETEMNILHSLLICSLNGLMTS